MNNYKDYYAPYKYSVTDEYGSNYTVYVPNGDIMLEGESYNYVTSNNIRMVLDAYSTGRLQLYPWGTKNWNDRLDLTGDVRVKFY